MAIFNGANGADSIGGSDENDLIRGYNGNDRLHGSLGDDEIYGGNGDDSIDGGIGNDTLYGDAGDDLLEGGDGNDVLYGGSGQDSVYGGNGDDLIVVEDRSDLVVSTFFGSVVGRDIIHGGAGNDTLSIDLRVGDDLKASAPSGILSGTGNHANLVGVGRISFLEVENVSVRNSTAAGTAFEFNVDANAAFAFDDARHAVVSVESAQGSQIDDLDSVVYNGTSGLISASSAEQAYGVRIAGQTLLNGQSYTTDAGGLVTAVWNAVNGDWDLRYTAPTGLTNIVMGTTDIVDETIVAEILVNNGTGLVAVQAKFDLTYDIDDTVLDLTGATAGVRVFADNGWNYITDGAGNDTITGGADTDKVYLNNGGDNVVGTGDGNDQVYVNADGNNSIWAGAGNDYVDVTGNGNNTIGLGDGKDTVDLDGDGNNTVYAAAGNDYVRIDGDGHNTIWAGLGNDKVDVYGDGNNTIGAGVGNDDVYIYGDGDNTVYAAAGNDYVYLDGEGDNLIFLGAGNDTIEIGSDAIGNNVIYGGAGSDVFDFDSADAAATLIFERDSGADRIQDFNYSSGKQVLDLSAYGVTESDLIFNYVDDDTTLLTLRGVLTFSITFDADMAGLVGAIDEWLIL